MREKKDFTEMLEEVKHEVEKFKDYENKNKEAEFNRYIVSINTKLAQLTEDMIKINEQETDLEFPVSDQPLIDELKTQIKPYEELWTLVRDYQQRTKLWYEGELLKLDPEEVEKDHKSMFTISNKLAARFGNSKL